ncbi:DUF1611 domain-containing protein [bacterium]|nr:DUF1611 domain-containing protein [bacterium]
MIKKQIKFEGNAIVYCQGMYTTTCGKTAHGLVRRSRRYQILSVVDRTVAGQDAGTVLDGKPAGIPLLASLDEAILAAEKQGTPASHLVVGIAPDGGGLPEEARRDIYLALEHGLNADSGLHTYLLDDPEFVRAAEQGHATIRDIRKTPSRDQLHFFSGKIEDVKALKIALLGTDSAVGKRTTAWRLVDELNAAGYYTELIGTGQTAWLQGARYGIRLDALICDFLPGELEYAVCQAWQEQRPRIIIIEGQGSLLHPAYPGGFEILAATRPDIIILQHAPARTMYDGTEGYVIHPLAKQIAAIEMISEKPVVAVTLNHEDIPVDQIYAVSRDLATDTGLPVVDVLRQDIQPLLDTILTHLSKYENSAH